MLNPPYHKSINQCNFDKNPQSKKENDLVQVKVVENES